MAEQQTSSRGNHPDTPKGNRQGGKPQGRGKGSSTGNRKPSGSSSRDFRKPKNGNSNAAGRKDRHFNSQSGKHFDKPDDKQKSSVEEKKKSGHSAQGGERQPKQFNGHGNGSFGRQEKKPYPKKEHSSDFPKKRSDSGFKKGVDKKSDRKSFDKSRPERGNQKKRPPRGTEKKLTFAQRVQQINARKVALDTLLDVSVRDAYAQLALEKRLNQATLDRRDAAFVTQLVYGTIENRLNLDYRIDQVLIDKTTELEPIVREILRMGAYQLFCLDRVPDMAAVNESVELARHCGLEGLTGLINGVLRNMIRREDEVVWPDPEKDRLEYLSIHYSAPLEMCQLFADAFGMEQTEQILAYRNAESYEVIRPNLLRCDMPRLCHLLSDDKIPYENGLVDGTLRVHGGGDLTRLRAYANGLFVIQGESSVLAARAVGARPGQSILDACAAPGGKTSQISEMMQDTGRVYAWDTHAHRVDLIRGTAKRLHIENIRPAIRDAAVPKPDMTETLDGAIVDAPCTGSGVLLSKPDLKYRISKDGLDKLCHIQADILEAIAPMVKVGGNLVYSTCSIFPQENREQIARFLGNHPEYEVFPLGDLLPESLRSLEDEYGLQLYAHRDHMEGFYICRMRRKPV